MSLKRFLDFVLDIKNFLLSQTSVSDLLASFFCLLGSSSMHFWFKDALLHHKYCQLTLSARLKVKACQANRGLFGHL